MDLVSLRLSLDGISQTASSWVRTVIPEMNSNLTAAKAYVVGVHRQR